MSTSPTQIADLICLDITPEDHGHRKGQVRPLSLNEPLAYPEDAQPSHKYEWDVFNYLLEKKDALGIQAVFKFENLFIDGAILLADGKTRLAVEVKMRMNWMKACQAGWQLKQFMTRTEEATTNPVNGAIVFFEQFQGDGWDRKVQCRFLENGWNHWYLYHAKVEGRRVDLVRLSQDTFEHYGLALANSMTANVEQMSEAEKKTQIAAMNITGPAGA